MKRSPVPHAQPGDICIMLAEHAGNARPNWQTRLQAIFGGVCTRRLHVTCQRITPTNPNVLAPLLDEIQHISRMLAPFSISGEELQVWYSEVRECAIIKCMVTPGLLFEQYIAALNHLFDAGGMRRHYHGERIYTRIPVTVLEQIPHDITCEDDHHPLVQQPLFTVGEVHISQIAANNTFKALAYWPIGNQGGTQL
jgi:hypothetical protein